VVSHFGGLYPTVKKLGSSGIAKLERESLLKAVITKYRPSSFIDNNHFTIYKMYDK